MKTKLLLRTASALMLLHTMGHTLGALTWRDAPNDTIARVIRDMTVNHFDFMGRSVSLADFFSGYGMIMIAVLLLLSITLWLLSGETESTLAIKITPVFAVFLLYMAVVEWIYFFPLAAGMSFLAGVSTVFARVRMGKRRLD